MLMSCNMTVFLEPVTKRPHPPSLDPLVGVDSSW